MGKALDYPQSPSSFSRRRRKAFLAALAETGKVTAAAQAAGYATSQPLYVYRKTDKEFAEQWDAAIEAAGDMLEAEAIRRATEGVKEPILYKGKVVAWRINYSDGLLMFMLKGLRPKKFRDSNLHVDGKIDHNVGVAVLPMTAPSVENWEAQSNQVHSGHQVIDLEAQEIVPAELDAPKKTTVERG